MSTEARRAPVPPRPAAPPEPANPLPGPASEAPAPGGHHTPPAPRAETHPPAPGTPPAPAIPRPAVPPAPPVPPPAPPVETTARLRPVPPAPPLPPAPPAPQAPPPTATRRRPVGAVDLTPRPGTAPARPGTYHPPYPETPAETTTRLRPVPARSPARTAAAAVCAVLGLGLIGGAITGSWLTGDSAAESGDTGAYALSRSAWHSVPVDDLFPPTLKGDGAGPGATDRVWTRLAVAPDGGCAAGLDPLLLKALGPVGCERLVRATYTDATRSNVTTVGMVFTEADAEAMKTLGARFTTQHLADRSDLMPRTYPVAGTAAGAFGDRQRASWTVHVLAEVPVVVFSVSGFADGRTVAEPQPAAEAMADGATTAVAQAGLGHEAKGVADRVERALRRTATELAEKPE